MNIMKVSTFYPSFFRAAAIWILVGFSIAGSALADRQVTVSVVLRVPEGTQVPPNWLALMSSKGKCAYAAPVGTDGRVELSGQVPDDVTRLVVSLPPTAPSNSMLTRPVAIGELARSIGTVEANDRFAVPLPQAVELLPDRANYSVEFVLKPAIKVSGRFLDADGKAWASFADRSGGLGSQWYVRDKPGFEIGGVPKGEDSLLFVLTLPNAWSEVLPLTAAQTQTDLDLGEMSLRASAPPVAAPLSVAGTAGLPWSPGNERRSLTLAHESGGFIYDCIIDGQGAVRSVAQRDSEVLRFQPGRYFVLPGSAPLSPRIWKAIRLLRAGRAADVVSAGVPEFLVGQTPAQPRTVQVQDAIAALERLPD